MTITIQELSKSFGGRDIISNFSMEIDDGVRLCVCGPNGTGKSTVLRLLAGVESPDSGRVILPKGCRLGYVEQELDAEALNTSLLHFVQAVLPDWDDFWTEWEQATDSGDDAKLSQLMHRQHELEAVYGYNPEHRAQSVLTGLGFSERKWHRTLGQLSGGWRERAKLARVLTAGADVLLLDEPTNHLDIDAVEWLENFLLNFKGALVFVAHDRVFMDRIGSHVLFLGTAKPIFRKATFSQFLEFQEEIATQRQREAKALQGELDRKMAFVERFRAKATKARQAGSRQKMAKKLEKELEQYQPEAKRKELHFKWPEPTRTEKTVLSVADLAFSFPDGKGMWPPLTFSLFRGQRVALVGPNGCGKSTLLKILAGKLERCGGTSSMGSLVRMGYFSQHQLETLNAQGTVLGEIRRLSDPRTTEEELMSVLGLFLLGQQYFDRRVESLSGGEKSRLTLATLFLSRANFLVLDEPTNHLDLESREALISALDAFDGTVLLVAHDRWLLSAVADEAWALSREGLTVYAEGFAAYDAARKAASSAARQGLAALAVDATAGAGSGDAPKNGAENPAEAAKVSREEAKALKREQAAQRNAVYKKLKPLQEAYQKCEQELEEQLGEQAEVEATLASPETYANGAQTTLLLKRFNALKDSVEALMERMTQMEGDIAVLEAARAAVSDEGGL